MKPGLADKPVLVHIQLLRAVAILMVFGFHLNLPGLRFGYLGVDIFFVVSGFLMMKIYSDLGIKKIKQFYLKRFLRLIPAYLVVSLLTTFVFLSLVLPYEKISLVKQNFYAGIFVSNFYYWTENQYFSNSGLRPLLTFWSLSLEIQFYLILPFVFLLIKKSIKLLGLITFLSLFIFVVLDKISPETSFFLLPGRLWEFLVGVWLSSFLTTYNKNFRISIFTFRMALISFPVLILIFDLVGVEKSVILNVLAVIYTLVLLFIGFYWKANKSFLDKFGLLVGKYSYSIYLVHLPVISLFYYEPFLNDLNFGSNLKSNFASVVVVVLLSFVLFNFVEQPFRRGGTKKFLYFYLFFFSISVGLILTLPYFKNTGSNSAVQKISFSQEDRPNYRCGTFSRNEILYRLTRGPESCLLSSEIIGNRFLLVGNSHADSLNGVLNRKLESIGQTLYMLRDPMALNSRNLIFLEREVVKKNIDVIVMHSSPGQLSKLAINDFVNFIHKNDKKLIIIGPVPIYEKSVPLSVYNNYLYGDPLDFKTIFFFQNSYAPEVNYYRQISNSSKIIYFDSLKVFCSTTCRLTDKTTENLFYFDSSHLTNTGASFLLEDFENVVNLILK